MAEPDADPTPDPGLPSIIAALPSVGSPQPVPPPLVLAERGGAWGLIIAFVGVCLGLFVTPLAGVRWPGPGLAYPCETSVRFLERQIDARDAGAVVPKWLAAALSPLARLVPARDPVQDAIDAYIGLGSQIASSFPHAAAFIEPHLAVMLAESGRFGQIQAQCASLPANFVQALEVAWNRTTRPPTPPDPTVVRAILEPTPLFAESWAADRLEIGLAESRGDSETAAALRDRIAARGRRVVLYGVAWDVAILTGLAAAVILLAAWLLGPRTFGRRAADFAPWRAIDGWTVFVLVQIWFLVVSFAIATATLPWLRSVLWSSHLLIASVPMVWLARQKLAKPLGLGFRNAFGLGAGRPAAPEITVWVALVLGSYGAIGIAMDAVRARVWGPWHWLDGAGEYELYAAGNEVPLVLLNTVLGAPLFEELLYRGVLYATLRRHMRTEPAALLSAAVFAAWHLTGPLGYLEILLFGFVVALIYERTRSLLPCMLAHAAVNVIASGGIMWAWR